MNTIVATLFLILVFAVNGSALDEKTSNGDSPLMMIVEQSGENHRSDSESPNLVLQGRAQSERTDADNTSNQTRSTRTTTKDPTFSISSSPDQDPELEKAHSQLKLAYANFLEIAAISNRSSTPIFISPNNPNVPINKNIDEAAEEALKRCLQALANLNALEQKRGLPATPFDSNFSTPPERFRMPVHFLSSSSATPMHPSVDNTYGGLNLLEKKISFNSIRSLSRFSFKEHSASAPEESRSTAYHSLTLPRRQSENWPNHYDPFHPVKLVPTVISDTIVSAILVNHFFNIDYKYGVPAWFLANILASAVASTHLTTAIEARSPRWTSSSIKKIVTSNDYWNPVYFSYYTLAWSIMGMDKSFNVKPWEAAAFMVVSGMIRQQANLWINKKNPFSWNQNTQCIVKKNPFLWNQENINALASAPRSQIWRASWEYAPDVIGAFARSGASNVYGYLRGEALAATILPSTVRSGVIYMGGLFAYYAGYRLIEYASHPLYREKAAIDQNHLRTLESAIQEVAHSGLAASSGEVNPSHVGEQTLLLAATKVPTRFGVSKEALEASLNVLRSHLISYLKDPLFYRSEISCQKPPQEIKKAYATIDLLDMYKGHVTSSTTTSDQIQEASKELLTALETQHSDIENVYQQSELDKGNTTEMTAKGVNREEYSSHLPVTTITTSLGIDALIHLLSQYSGSNNFIEDNHQHFELNPLSLQQRQGGYGAIAGDSSYNNNDDHAPCGAL